MRTFTKATLSIMPHGYNFGFHTKADGVEILASHYGLSIDDFVDQSAAMDDGDLTFIGDPEWARGFGLIAVPANAKEGVKSFVENRNDDVAPFGGFVSEKEEFHAFREAYSYADGLGLQFFVTDLDGCLRKKDKRREAEFREYILPRMLAGGPIVIPITGSSYAQNADWARNCGLADLPADLLNVPFVMAIENGGVLYNPKTDERTNVIEMGNSALFQKYEQVVQNVRRRIEEEIAPQKRFGFRVALEKKDRIIYPSGDLKATMYSSDCPRSVDGDENFRETDLCKQLRGAMAYVVLQECERASLPVHITPTSVDWADMNELGEYGGLLH